MTSAAAPSEIELEFAAVHCAVLAERGLERRDLLEIGLERLLVRSMKRSALPVFTATGVISQANQPFLFAA